MAASDSANGFSPARRGKVEAARKRWISSLIDKSRRNSLLYFRPLKSGTLELTGADPKAMERLLTREEVPLSKLLPKTLELRTAEATLGEIRARAVMNSEERGLETLFLAMGITTWDSVDGERPAEAPVLLVPIKVRARARGGTGPALARTGEIQANLVLLHVLESEHRIKVEPEDLLKALQGDDEGEVYDPGPVYELLRLAARNLKGIAISDRLIIGNFAFQKTAMVKDLRECGEQLVAHDLIAAICGDVDAQRAVSERRSVADPAELDRTAPEDEFLFLDADSSQQMVIRHALALQDGTIQGPPGTGKSQTIANLIAEFAARGKRVLFVAEKRAALDVVRHRLSERGLEHLALDLHGAEISRRQVLDALRLSRNLVRQAPPVDADKQHAKLTDRRDRLQQHVRRMHSGCPPTELTLFQIQGALLRLGGPDLTQTRWDGEALDKITQAAIDKAQDLMSELEECRDLFLRISSSPWNGANLPDAACVRRATRLVDEIVKEWPGWLERALNMCGQAGLIYPSALTALRTQLAAIMECRRTLDQFRPELFTEVDLPALSVSLQPAARSPLGRLWTWITNGDYRTALRTARKYRLPGQVSAPMLLEEILEARDRRERWLPLTIGQTAPCPVPAFLEIAREWDGIESRLKDLFTLLDRQDLYALTLDDLSHQIERLSKDKETPAKLPHLLGLEAQLASLGVAALVEELRCRKPEADAFKIWLEHAWYASALDQALQRDVSLAAFQGRTHDKIVDEFRRLDRDRIRIAADRVRRAHAERAVARMNEFPNEDTLVRTECQRKRSIMSVRKLFMDAPHVATALRPCWMASPLSVSHLLPADRHLFDIVLFDEASQVFPYDAVPALLRAPRAIVAGDRHQLPPTAFFLSDEVSEDEPDEQNVAIGFESILDQMSGLFDPWTLDWHYRSLDESLIAFSNRHIYDERLVTFPGPGQHRAIQHVLVEQRMIDGQEDSVSEEARKVVELVLHHAIERPTESLGVIALGIKHQRRIEAALDEARRDRPDLDAFFSEANQERFFVKNLERVQGDERDAIILSVGYGKDRSGRLPYRFGPLATEGGKRRMNVAVTRARRRMAIVSSFSPHDMDPAKCREGVEFLRLYLQYAMSGGANLGVEQPLEVPLNDFEQGVFDALAARGVKLLKQWGASRYRIDLVAQHPEKPGRHVLAIECDGASYHSAQSARDRDRLRQQHLEALGWRFHRIWSTDWFNNRVVELDRTLKAYDEAIRAADQADGGESNLNPRPRASRESTPSSPKRGRKPFIPQRDSIEEYLSGDLIRCVEYIMSDQLLRTDDEILGEMIEFLGFERRGARIVERIRSAIQAYRAGQAEPSVEHRHSPESEATTRAIENLVRRYHLDVDTFRHRRGAGSKISDRDIVWGMFNEDVQRLMMRSDFQALATRYYEMALFTAEDGRSFVEFLTLSQEMMLRQLQRMPGVSRVRIAASLGCDGCRKQDGTVMPIKEALHTMPLPCSSCTTVVVGTMPGFCRCVYEPEV